MTTRRDALLALPILCPTSQVSAQAPQAGPPKRLGVLFLGREAEKPYPNPHGSFYMALRQRGWSLGDNLAVEPAYADWKLDRLAGLAEQLVDKRVNLILTDGDLPAVAAARATRTIPVVVRNLIAAVELGLVDSYARPGRNVTGQALISGSRTELESKRLVFLKEVVPNAKRLAWVGPAQGIGVGTVAGGKYDPTPMMETGATALGFETKFFPWLALQDVDAVFDAVAAWRPQAVTAGFGWVYVARQRTAELLLRHRLPSAFLFRENVESGGLLSYGAEFADPAYKERRFVEYVDQLLRGTPPAELPVEGPRQYQLVINLKTANSLGLTIPQSLLLRADEVIQ